MAPKPNYRPETLGGLEEHQVDVLITCLACNRYVTISSGRLIAKLGRGFPVPKIAKRTRCQQRGRRSDESRPD